MPKFWEAQRRTKGIPQQTLDEEKRNFCQNRVSADIAIVEIYYGSQFVTKMSQTVSTTFTGKMASVGKYVVLNFFYFVPFNEKDIFIHRRSIGIIFWY